MYNWRRMTEGQREYVLNIRKVDKRPWHSPPHNFGEKTQFHLTASCFEHQNILGSTAERMAEFEYNFLDLINSYSEKIYAWCILPNHYHILLKSGRMKILIKEIGRLHGRTSYKWNAEDNARGRKVWFRCVETAVKSENHFWSTMNYIHNNPVHHGYVGKWQEWCFPSASEFIDEIGKEKIMEIWQKYPLTGYGKGWDDPEF